MKRLFQILHTFLTVGILAVLVLIFLRLGEPISVNEPVAVTGSILQRRAISVDIDNTPLEVEISR
jgi:hypothetical protein